ncbi:hypothetical protein RHSIM_Rhsim01G0078600 [Rhododendron simsii]|uniref:Uncharacterized protein n=1 Tax=Rhododendron simsii TaxID=118357 RepID=A0A834HIG7_RHOSS|nr:hypothetical protein RHSIM_Rhsim01G0078600 [Rhododendron simsii]
MGHFSIKLASNPRFYDVPLTATEIRYLWLMFLCDIDMKSASSHCSIELRKLVEDFMALLNCRLNFIQSFCWGPMHANVQMTRIQDY